MPRIWLYHINPKSRYGYTYGWKLEDPKTIFRSSDRVWSARGMRDEARVGDLISVFTKNVPGKPDGVYVNGYISEIDTENGEFTWRPDPARSARTLVTPIPVKVIRRFFPRSYGHGVQLLAPSLHAQWNAMIGRGEVVGDIPVVKVHQKPKNTVFHGGDPRVSAAHGRLGERHVITVLKSRFSKVRGSRVVHVAAKNPSADHDVEVWVGC